MQHCFADNMVDRKLYVIVIVIGIGLTSSSLTNDNYTTQQQSKNWISDSSTRNLRTVVMYNRYCKPLINPPLNIGDRFSLTESPTIKIGEFKMKAVVSEVQ